MRRFGSHLPASRYIRAQMTRCRLLRLRNVPHHRRRTLPLKTASIAPSRPKSGSPRPRLDLLSSRHARLSISLLLPSKMQIFPRFCPLSPQHYEQSRALGLTRPLTLSLTRLPLVRPRPERPESKSLPSKWFLFFTPPCPHQTRHRVSLLSLPE